MLYLFGRIGPIALLALALPGAARAAEDDERILRDPAPLSQKAESPLPPGERFTRAEAVLAYFGAPAETPNRSGLAPFTDRQSSLGAAKILPYLDPQAQVPRFFTLSPDLLQAYLDRDQKAVADFAVPLSPPGQPLRSGGLEERFRRAARNNPRSLPLQGLRIALDPGHMGGEDWDTRTGKFVRGPGGEKISEAVLNLQTSLLLERELSGLGATVFITHRKLGAVSELPLERLSLQEFGRQELRNESLSPWFESLLSTAPPGPALYEAFARSAPYQKLFSPSSRDNYFILRADLAARSDAMAAFHPDISLIIHFDAAGPNTVSPTPVDGTKVYVVGSFSPTELATQKSRQRLARHLLDPEAWNSSLGLGRAIVQQLKNGLGVRFDRSGGGASLEVEPGVFARNLGVSAALSAHAVSYLEVLHYDDPAEFRLLREAQYDLIIGDGHFPYGDRLVQVVGAIKKGVLSFVAGYGAGTDREALRP